MGVTSNIYLQINLIAVIVAFIAWFYMIIDLFVAARFAPFAFKTSIPITETKKPITLNQSRIPSDGKLVTKTGWILFVDNQTCYFRPRWEWKWYGIQRQGHNPFSIRGKISWQDGEARIEYRVPIGIFIFFLCVLVGFTTAGIESLSEYGLPILIGSWIFIGAMVLFGIGTENERADKIVEELRESIL